TNGTRHTQRRRQAKDECLLRQDLMKSSTETLGVLKKAQFSEAQARALIAILQAAGVVEPEEPETELYRIEEYLRAEPFEPFVIGMTGGKNFLIERRDQCGFSRDGSVQLFGLDNARWCILNSDHITRVKKA